MLEIPLDGNFILFAGLRLPPRSSKTWQEEGTKKSLIESPARLWNKPQTD